MIPLGKKHDMQLKISISLIFFTIIFYSLIENVLPRNISNDVLLKFVRAPNSHAISCLLYLQNIFHINYTIKYIQIDRFVKLK